MKKTLKTFLSLILVCFASLIVAGCGPKLKSLSYVEGSMDTTLYIGDTLDTSDFQAIATFDDDTQKTLNEEDVEFNDDELDLTTAGTKTLEYSYKGMTDEIEITVINPDADAVSMTYVEDSIPTVLNIGDDLDLSDFSAKVKFSDNSEITVHEDDVIFNTSSIDWETPGFKNLTFTYGNITKTITIEVVESTQINIFESQIVNKLQTNKADFKLKDKPYLVGDDNEFNFRINATGFDSEDNEIVVKSPSVIMEIYIKNGNDSVKLNKSEIATYFDNYSKINENKTNKLDFSEMAIGETFKVKVTSKYFDETEHETAPYFELEFDVVDGYNVYDAKGLSLLDNSSAETTPHYMGWDTVKSAAEIQLSNQINGMILHSDIYVTKDDVPANFFWTAEEISEIKDVTTTISNAEDRAKLVGTLKDNADLTIYRREFTNNFNFEGNFYQISIAGREADEQEGLEAIDEFPLISIENLTEQSSSAIGNYVHGGEAITPHSALIRFLPKSVESAYKTVNVNNVSFLGNGRRTGSSGVERSGGLILMKSEGVKLNVNNSNHLDFVIGYFSNYYRNATPEDDQTSNVYDNCIGKNAFNTLFYFHGVQDVKIKNSEFKSAGGPAIIIDNVRQKIKNEQDQVIGVISYPSNVELINSEIESFVRGDEAWFNTYPAALELVPGLKAANQLFLGADQLSGGLLAPKTYLTVQGEGAEKTYDMFNLIAVYKSSEAEDALGGTLYGSVTVRDSETDTECNPLLLQGLEGGLSKEALVTAQAMGGNGAIYFQSESTGGYINTAAGTDYFANQGAYSGLQTNTDKDNRVNEYLNAYLPNGMGVLLGLYPATMYEPDPTPPAED